MSEPPPSSTSSTPTSATIAPPPCPILCWLLTLNREYVKEEYDACYTVVQECVPHVSISYNPNDPDSFRHLITHMLPLLMMRHRRIPRARWRDCANANGKRWIEQLHDEMPPERFLYSMIGYHLEFENSICGMAMTQGPQRRVVNIGLGLKQMTIPKGINMATYIESISHKLTEKEKGFVTDVSDATALNRISMLLALKQAYVRAVGQPLGFDFSRLEFDVPAEKARGDGEALEGWEFRIFKSSIGVARRNRVATSGARPHHHHSSQPSSSTTPTATPASGAQGANPSGAGGAGGGGNSGESGGGTEGSGSTTATQTQIQDILVEEAYQCVVAFFRGTKESKFIWYDSTKQLETWVQFITIDQMMKVIPKLNA